VVSLDNRDLIRVAKETRKPMKLREDFSSGDVGCAILSGSGIVYTGVCIDLACGLGFCAEVSAIADMLKNGETRIIKLAVAFPEDKIGVPCGRCREMMIQIDKENMDTKIILGEDKEITLKELLPLHWLD